MSNTPKKPTKKENFSVISAILDAAENNGIALDPNAIVTYTSLHEFIDHEIELLENKAVAAAKRAAENKQKGDELRERIFNVLSDTEFMTIKEIENALGDPDVSAQMITARLTQLASPEVNRVEKDTISVSGDGKTKKLSAYRRLA